MMQQGGTAESQIKAVIEAWADAVRRHDLPGILAHHEQDIVMFDVPPPLQSRGMDEYKKTWDLFFKYHKPSQAFDIEELSISAGEDVAFAFDIMRCGSGTFSGPPEEGGFLFRLTIGLRNIDGGYRARASLCAGDGLAQASITLMRALFSATIRAVARPDRSGN
jgi:ketosteroid isomerase-like protein